MRIKAQQFGTPIFPIELDTGAVFSIDKTYRYTLWRTWDKTRPKLGGLLLNPSTATEVVDDPTVYRMGMRARFMGYGGLVITNIFALRSTDPAALYTAADPVGPENDHYIIEALKPCGLVICGYGKHGALHGRGAFVLELLRQNGIIPHALKINGDGSPAHPLYLPYHLQPVKMETR
jgi:hypothetical protein